ncbi:hypothetical protein ABTX77_35735 [Streptomyces sp. NPDC097704]|uniref:DUF3885 domain-containing protein n=1 Tax=Streptomyces sp. NPDC097704 TaxID=3157101 RepID=UPI00332E6539
MRGRELQLSGTEQVALTELWKERWPEFAERRPRRRGCIDGLLREVADDEVADVLVTDVRMERIHHPYDGGADIFLATPAERDRLRDQHTDWLSSHPAGL